MATPVEAFGCENHSHKILATMGTEWVARYFQEHVSGNPPGGEPAFDATANDYQDFELPIDDEVGLVNKILQYAGMSIREISVAQFGQANEAMDNQEEK